MIKVIRRRLLRTRRRKNNGPEGYGKTERSLYLMASFEAEKKRKKYVAKFYDVIILRILHGDEIRRVELSHIWLNCGSIEKFEPEEMFFICRFSRKFVTGVPN